MSNTLFQNIMQYTMSRLDEIDKKYDTSSKRSSQWRKLSNRIHKDLLSKDKQGNRNYSDNTYHTKLTEIINAVKATGRKHPALLSTTNKKGYLVKVISQLPDYEKELKAISKMSAETISKGKADLKGQIQQDLHNKELAMIKATDALSTLLINHPFIDMLSKPEAMRSRRSESETASLNNKSTNMKRYNMTAVLKLAKELIEPPEDEKDESYTALAWGLALLTGRRSVEILHHAKFTRVDSRTVMFEGQAKKRFGTKTDAYPIPVLADADKIIKALARLRGMDEVKRFTDSTVRLNGKDAKTADLKPRDLNKAINQSTNGALNDRAKSLFKDASEVFKNTRGIYARHCSDSVRLTSKHFKGANDQPVNEDSFLKNILGHVKVNEVKHYRQVELSHDDKGDWLKIVEKKKEKTKATPAEKAKPVKKNWRATKGIKEMGESIEAYEGGFVDLLNDKGERVRKVSIRKVTEFHFEQLRFWAAENPKESITQTTVTKNKGNTKESGTGGYDLKANRYTFQAWLQVVGADNVEAYNAGKDDD